MTGAGALATAWVLGDPPQENCVRKVIWSRGGLRAQHRGGGDAGQGATRRRAPAWRAAVLRASGRADLAFPLVLPPGPPGGQVHSSPLSTAKEEGSLPFGTQLLNRSRLRQLQLRAQAACGCQHQHGGGWGRHTAARPWAHPLLLCSAPMLGTSGATHSAQRGFLGSPRCHVGRPRGCSFRLNSRALSWYQSRFRPALSRLCLCCALGLQDRLPGRTLCAPPQPGSPTCLKAICSCRPAGQQTCSLG